MVDTPTLVALAFTLIGALISIAALTHTRAQAHANRRQAENAQRIAILQTGRDMRERFASIRSRQFLNPSTRAALLAAVPAIATSVEDAGGHEAYVIYREMMDLAQESYFLRKHGVMEDEHWHVWVSVLYPRWAKIIPYVKVYQAHKFTLTPEFVRFADRVLDGAAPADPLASA